MFEDEIILGMDEVFAEDIYRMNADELRDFARDKGIYTGIAAGREELLRVIGDALAEEA